MDVLTSVYIVLLLVWKCACRGKDVTVVVPLSSNHQQTSFVHLSSDFSLLLWDTYSLSQGPLGNEGGPREFGLGIFSETNFPVSLSHDFGGDAYVGAAVCLVD